MQIKTAREMVEDAMTINNGLLKGARVTLSIEQIIQLMEQYHEQFNIEENG